MKTDQLLLRPSIQLLERLDACVEHYGKRSRNEIAVEVLERYLPLWEAAEQAKHAVINQHLDGVDTSGVYSRGSGKKKGEIGKVLKDAQSRKAKRQ